MAQHSNYAKDRDLMMEAYGSVSGYVPRTSTTALPRGYVLTEAHCDEESSESVELGGDLYEVGAPDPSNESELVIKIEKHANGYKITTGQFSSPEDFATKGPDSAIEAGGYALSLDGQPMEEDDLEDGLGHEDNEQSEGAAYMAPEGMGEDNEHMGEENEFPENEEGDAADRLEGLYNTDLMAVFMDTVNAIIADVQQDEPFEKEDVIEHLLIKKLNELKSPAEDSSCASH